jgi:hypothetical protein
MDVLSTRSNYRGSPHLDSLALACVSLLTNKEKAIILLILSCPGTTAATESQVPRRAGLLCQLVKSVAGAFKSCAHRIKSRIIGGVALTKPNGPRAKPKLQRDNPYMGLHQRVWCFVSRKLCGRIVNGFLHVMCIHVAGLFWPIDSPFFSLFFLMSTWFLTLVLLRHFFLIWVCSEGE